MQGCSVLPDPDVIQDTVQVHAIVEQFQAHILDMIGTQDVEGKTAELGKNVRIGSDAGLVFPQRHIPDMVIAVLDAPVSADTRTELWSPQHHGGDAFGGTRSRRWVASTWSWYQRPGDAGQL